MDTGDDDFTGSRMLAAQVTQPGQQGKHVGYARTTNCHSLNSEGKSSGAGPSSASKRQSDAAVPDLTLPHHPCTRSSAKVTHILRNKWFKRCIPNGPMQSVTYVKHMAHDVSTCV